MEKRKNTARGEGDPSVSATHRKGVEQWISIAMVFSMAQQSRPP
jgi:hypothetical protein